MLWKTSEATVLIPKQTWWNLTWILSNNVHKSVRFVLMISSKQWVQVSSYIENIYFSLKVRDTLSERFRHLVGNGHSKGYNRSPVKVIVHSRFILRFHPKAPNLITFLFGSVCINFVFSLAIHFWINRCYCHHNKYIWTQSVRFFFCWQLSTYLSAGI